MNKNSFKNIINNLEKYQTLIGTLLMVSILVASAIMLVLNFQSEKNNDNSNELAQKVANLEQEQININNKINQIIDSLNQNKTSTNDTSGTVKGASTSSKSAQNNSAASTGLININSASLSQLDSLSGIGPIYAQRIIDYRFANGGFKSIEDIKNVKGIGDKTFEKFKSNITI
ncbi:MAG: comEA protein [Berkelbacteria bacterium GW2011_GWA2_35_9]|uniref:ComEA protein n=1 Tax=Berkelbacteria bacterium GW2011_GWA2_35_9 TaxID=1618333 RepID=A0A0G0D4B7_9BACT|nr:MAG: comEA protein [Berkelbacteria bacterium GW2011_GWA2_35_9]